MYCDFDEMPKSSRVWVYQADRMLQPDEIDWLNKVARVFCEQWAAHGQDLRSSYRIFHDQFLVLAVDEAASLPSGCSIDSSVHLVTQAQRHLDVDFFDRMKVAFLENGKVVLESASNLKEKINLGEITRDMPTFNNLVSTIAELDERWTVPAGETWVKKYFA